MGGLRLWPNIRQLPQDTEKLQANSLRNPKAPKHLRTQYRNTYKALTEIFQILRVDFQKQFHI